MIFAPVMRRAACPAYAQSADMALQRFLQSAVRQPAAPSDCRTTQDDQATTVQLDVPGLAREQLHVSIDGTVVQVRSVDGAPRQVQRAWELPEPIDAAASSAKLEHGVLTLMLAKRPPVSSAVQLVVQ